MTAASPPAPALLRRLEALRSWPASPPVDGRRGDPGLFGPDSAAWRIGRERAVLLGGPAALLLQVAHPLVAAGVAEHSAFEADPLRRLTGTLDAVLAVTFGDREQAAAAARRVAGRHVPVHGVLTEGAGGFAAGTAYRAGDSPLALWVHATLVWTAIRTYRAFVGPLDDGLAADYVAQMWRFAAMFGVTDEVIPAGYDGFERYVEDMLDDVLAVGPAARTISAQIAASAPLPGGGPLTALLAAGLLPPNLREQYGFGWSARQRATFRGMAAAARASRALLPEQARYWPHYLSAHRRVASYGPRR